MGRRRLTLGLPAAVVTAAVAFLVLEAAPGVQFLARGLLAGVFLLAGVAKLSDRRSFSDALTGFGIRGAVSLALAALLPLAELAVAAALLLPATSTVGALGALALLVPLTAAVAVALARGRTADCGCFGKDRSAPLSAVTLLRNGVLVGLAGAIAVAGSGKQDATFAAPPSDTALAAMGVAVFVAIGLLAARRGRGEVTNEPNVGVALASAEVATDAALTRRRLIRVAGGAGLAGALGTRLGWLDPSSADAALRGGGSR